MDCLDGGDPLTSEEQEEKEQLLEEVCKNFSVKLIFISRQFLIEIEMFTTVGFFNME